MIVRSFIGVELPADTRTALHATAQALAASLDGLSWVKRPENLHVTLKFLGQVDVERIPALAAALRARTEARPTFSVAVRGLGGFPSDDKANIVWAGVDDPDGALAALAGDVEAVAEAAGFPRETRPFRGHVTLGRARRRPVDAGASLRGTGAFGPVSVRDVLIFESRPGRGGSEYIERARIPLGAVAAKVQTNERGEHHGDREERHL